MLYLKVDMTDFKKIREDRIRAAMYAECLKLEDGYFYWWPKELGTFSPSDLRMMADIIDSMNAEWDAQVTKDLSAN